LSSLRDALAVDGLDELTRGWSPLGRAPALGRAPRGDETPPLRRSGAEGARYSPRGLLPTPLGRDELSPEGRDAELPPLLELPPPPPPEGRDAAEPLLLPVLFGRAPACPLSWA
jgi:hypothetical protein